MEEDQNYLKVKKIILFFLSFLLSLNCFANEIKISKIVELEDPWGSTFINKNELIILDDCCDQQFNYAKYDGNSISIESF